MAGEQSSSASPRPQPHRRTSSTLSLGKAGTAAGGQRAKTGKAHAVGKHNRNRSFGRDLNKLTRLAGAEDAVLRPTQMGRTTSNPGQTPSSGGTVKRNKSDVALPRTGHKAHIKKNQSSVSLKRNDSHKQLKRLSRPTTPKGSKEQDEAQQKHAQPAFTIDTEDDEDQEDEWTEESASVSPIITRHGSMKGQRPANLQVNGTQSGRTSPASREVKPKSPTTPVVQKKQAPLQEQKQFKPDPTRLPDPAIITNRLLRQTSRQRLAPKLSTVSAGGSSGTQSPLHQDADAQLTISQTLSRTSSGLAQPSVPSEGVSRFLDPGVASSSGGDNFSSQMHGDSEYDRAKSAHSRSSSPNPSIDQLRRAKSALNMGGLDGRSRRSNTALNGEISESDPRLWTVDPSHRNSGGNTQAKMDLWRTQTSLEPNTAPPKPLIGRSGHGVHIDAYKYGGDTDRRMRLAEEAESELAYLRMYRNPAIEGIERIRAMNKKRELAKKHKTYDDRNGVQSKGVAAAYSRTRREDRSRPNSSQDTLSGSFGTTVAGSVGTQGRRNVRFSIGGDAHDETHEDAAEEVRLASLLRSLWYGGDGDTASLD